MAKRPHKLKTPKVFRRRMVGLKVMGGGRTFPQVYAIYDVDYTDGSRKMDRGYSVHVTPGSTLLNGTKKEREWAQMELRPELEPVIRAASVLFEALERACSELDSKRGKPEV